MPTGAQALVVPPSPSSLPSSLPLSSTTTSRLESFQREVVVRFPETLRSSAISYDTLRWAQGSSQWRTARRQTDGTKSRRFQSHVGGDQLGTMQSIAGNAHLDGGDTGSNRLGEALAGRGHPGGRGSEGHHAVRGIGLAGDGGRSSLGSDASSSESDHFV